MYYFGFSFVLYFLAQYLMVPFFGLSLGSPSFDTGYMYLTGFSITSFLVGFLAIGKVLGRSPFDSERTLCAWDYEVWKSAGLWILLIGFVGKFIRFVVTGGIPEGKDIFELNLTPNFFHGFGLSLLCFYFLARYRYSAAGKSSIAIASILILSLCLWGWITYISRAWILSSILSVLIFCALIFQHQFKLRSLIFSIAFVAVIFLVLSLIKDFEELNGSSGISFYDWFLSNTLRRISHAHILSQVLEVWRGPNLWMYGWTDLFSIPELGIHRSYIGGEDFGFAFGFITDELTGVSPTLFGDLYIRFGPYGTGIACLLLGGALAYFYFFITSLPMRFGIPLLSLIWPIMLAASEDFIIISANRIFQYTFIVVGAIWFADAIKSYSDRGAN